MKKSGIITFSALLFAASSAYAESPQQGPESHQQQNKRPLQAEQHGEQRSPKNQPRNGQQSAPQSEPHRDAMKHDRPADKNTHHASPQTASHSRQPHPDFRKGRPLPEKYRGEGYQVSDWRQHGLEAPPAGHRWQRIDGNYVLIAVATGVITSVITHR